MTNERFRVRPGMSIDSKELYRRYRNGTLNVQEPGERDFSQDTEVLSFTRMSKGEQMQSLTESMQKVDKLKKSVQE